LAVDGGGPVEGPVLESLLVVVGVWTCRAHLFVALGQSACVVRAAPQAGTNEEPFMALSENERRRRHLRAAEGYVSLELPDFALRELRRVKDPGPLAAAYYTLLGEALRQKEQYDEALEAYERADQLKPHDLTVGVGKAWCYKRTGQLHLAIRTMEELYRHHPKESIVLYNLSCYLALAGRREEALSWLGRALRLDGSLRRLIPDESDFDSLRDDPQFRMIAGLDVDGTEEPERNGS